MRLGRGYDRAVEGFPFVRREMVRFGSVLVGYDYERAQSAPIPERRRRRLSG